MPHRRFSRGTSNSQKRKKTWSPLLVATGGPLFGTLDVTQVTGLTVQDLFVFTPQGYVEDGTIIRTHLSGFVGFDKLTVDASQRGYTFAVGVVLVSPDAATTGGTAVPQPSSTEGATWDGWLAYALIGIVNQYQFIEPRDMQIDSKAMRKIQNQHLIVAVSATNGGTSGLGTISYSLAGRNFIMLP